MLTADDIKALVTKRDEALKAAEQELIATLTKLNNEFAIEQRKLAESFMTRDQAANVKAQAAHLAAVKEFDAALSASLGETLTIDEIVKTYKVSELKAFARSVGVSGAGKEAEIAQRLLDAGWKP